MRVRYSSRSFALGLSLAYLVGCRGNPQGDPNATRPSPAATLSAPSASARPSPSTVQVRAVACTPRAEVVVDKASVGFNVSDVVDVAVAANAGTALVAFAADGDHGCKVDGCYALHEAFAFEVGVVDADADAGATTGPKPVKTSAAGISPRTDAVPLTLGGELYLLSQGHAGAAALQRAKGADVPDTMYLVRGDSLSWRSEKWFSGSYAAAAGEGLRALVVGTGVEAAAFRNGTAGAPAVRAFPIALEKGPEGVLVTKATVTAEGDESDGFDSPAVATSASRAALAYRRADRRMRKGEAGDRRVMVGWLDPVTARPTAAPIEVDHGDVGAPALVLDGETLHAVYAKRGTKQAPYVLMHATWTNGDARPSAPSSVAAATGARSPAIVRVAGNVALAWSSGDSDETGAVYAGFGASVEKAAAAAVLVSGAAKNARDPELAVGGDQAVLVWTEHGATRRIRVATCK